MSPFDDAKIVGVRAEWVDDHVIYRLDLEMQGALGCVVSVADSEEDLAIWGSLPTWDNRPFEAHIVDAALDLPGAPVTTQ